MRYVLAILIMGAGFWYWMQPREDIVYHGTGGTTMSDAEKAYYIQLFNHTMSHIRDGQSYGWQSYNTKGNITPTKTYVSKSKSLCRQYTESYAIGGHDGEQSGIACKRRGKAGWCRIGPGDAQTCALENPRIALNFGQLNVGTIDVSGIQLGDVEVTIPTVDIGYVQTPEIDTPDMPDIGIRERKDGETTAEWLIQ